MRHQVRPLRRRGDLQADALHRRPEAGRPLRRQGHVRGGRHSAPDEDAARPRLPARRLHDGDRPHNCRKHGASDAGIPTRTSSARRTSPITPTGGVVGLKGNLAPEGRHREGGGDEEAPASPARRAASTARRSASRRSARGTTRKARFWSSATRGRAAGRACARCCRRPRRSTGRAMGDKVALITDGRFSGGDARLLHRPCRAGGGARRPDRAAARWRHHRDRRRGGHARREAFRRRNWRRGAASGGRAKRITDPARCGNTRSSSDRRGTGRSRIQVRPPKR